MALGFNGANLMNRKTNEKIQSQDDQLVRRTLTLIQAENRRKTFLILVQEGT